MPATSPVELLTTYVHVLEARDWAALTALLDEDVVYRLPQTREVVRGRDHYLRWNTDYPDVWHLRLVEAYGDETGAAARLSVRIDGVPEPVDALVFVRAAEGRLVEITDWWPEPYDPPPGRDHLATRE
jgi:ketosteroid isomerase-like protein